MSQSFGNIDVDRIQIKNPPDCGNEKCGNDLFILMYGDSYIWESLTRCRHTVL